jgi:hypothetical protein
MYAGKTASHSGVAPPGHDVYQAIVVANWPSSHVIITA